MIRWLTVLICLVQMGSHADRKFFVNDNAFGDVPAVEDQARLLKELGYDGICTRPKSSTPELLAAFDRHDVGVLATYVTLSAKDTEVPAGVLKHFELLKGRGTIVWLMLLDKEKNASDEETVAIIRKVFDAAAENELPVVLYPHVGCRTSTVKECDRLRALAKRHGLGVSFNLGHFLRQNEDEVIEDAIRSIAPHLKLVQINGADNVPMPVPDYLDYELWQGPAPLRPYTLDRVHHTNPETGEWTGRPGWLRLSDYCAGMICNWGGHLMDVANFINGSSHTGPVSVEGTGKFQDHSKTLWDGIIDLQLQYKYANGVVLDYKIDKPYLRVEGDEGWIQAHWHSKGGLQAHDKMIFRTKFKPTDKMVPSRSDKRDFISAIMDGTPVMIDAEAGHRVNSQCLMGLAAIKTGKRLEWDPVAEKIINSAKGEELMKYSFHRDPWKLERFV